MTKQPTQNLKQQYASMIAQFATQEKAAAALNVSRATINRRLRGKSTVTHEMVMAARQALDTTNK